MYKQYYLIIYLLKFRINRIHIKRTQIKNTCTFFFHPYALFFHLISLLLCCLLFSSTVRADQASLTAINNSGSHIGEHLVVLEESLALKENEHALTLKQAQQAYQQGKFSHWEKAVLSFGIGVSPRWLVAEIKNPDAHNITRRFIIENSWLDKIDIYILRNEQVLEQIHLGDSYPFSSRIIEHRFFAFDHNYAPGVSQIFIRVETPDPMMLPVFFGSQEESARRDMFNGYSYGMLYGIITALLLYNFILYIQLRLIRYLFYVIYLAMFILMNQSYTGHAYPLFWAENTLWQQWMNPLLITLYALSGIIFTFLFLKTRKLFPRIFYTTLTASLALLIVQLIFFIMSWQAAAVILAISFVVFFSLFSLFITIISLKYALQEVWFFLIATIATLIGAFITALTVFGILPYYEFTYRAVEIGVSIDVILLSIALAEQFRILQNEKQVAEQLSRLDPLTGLFNRRAFHEQAKYVLYNTQRYQKNLSGILLDIDDFKTINDKYGHNTGDEVIKKTAEMIQTIVRKGDVSVRWGGEEFVILLPENGQAEAKLLAERLRENVEKLTLPTAKGPLRFTVSQGVAEMSVDMTSIDDLIKLADNRMYQAKKNGRNQVC